MLITQRWFGAAVAVIAGLVAYKCVREPAASTATFRTQNLTVDEDANLSDINHPTNFHGPTRQSLSIPGAGYPYGEVNQVDLVGATPDFPNDLFAYAIRNHATADTTAHSQHTGGIAVEVDGARTAGGFDKINTAIECQAVNGQTNECLHVLAGDVTLDGGGAFTQNSGFAFFAGTFLAATGPIIAENNGLRAIYISADPGPTDSIYSNAANPTWNAHHGTGAILKLYNDAGEFTLDVNGGVFGVQFIPDGIATLTAGAFGTGSTTLSGTITGVGAVTTTITYAHAFPTRARCMASILGATAQVITIAANTTTQATFDCFDMVGVAQNCQDFNYWCTGQ